MTEVPWLTIARDLIGLREIKGAQHEPEILRLWRDAHLPFTDDETAWCAGFVGGVLERANINSTRSAMARSYTLWGIDVFEDRDVTRIPLGAVLVFSRPPSETSGHVGFATAYTSDGRVMCLGGNQKDSVNIAPFDVDRILTARWPAEFSDDLRIEYQTIQPVTTNLQSSRNEA